MEQKIFTITSNEKLVDNPRTGHVYRMTLGGDTSDITTPGQFVNIQLESRFLRRPISVNDCREGELTLLYKVVGSGTEIMSELKTGTELDVLTGLGNGFDVSAAGDKPVLIGGGIGVAPLYLLAKELVKRDNTEVTVILGFRSDNEIFYKEEFETLGCKVLISTEDGSFGIKGFVTDALKTVPSYSQLYTCGPTPMTRAVARSMDPDISGQFSLEERMGCGFGACMGCSIMTVNGYKRVCKDGPVFRREELIWED